MNKIKVIQAVNQLGLGGTEYALQLFAKYLNKEFFDVKVVAILNGGERVKLIEDIGIEVTVLNGNLSSLPQILQETDVFHWHGNGLLDPELFNIIKKNKPKIVIQTNVFGYFDNSIFYDLIDYDLYISNMILIRRMQLDIALGEKFINKRKVLSYPVDIDLLNSISYSESDITIFKERYGLQGHFIIGRIGRADDHKFDLITLDGFAEFAKTNNKTKFLLVGATQKIKDYAKLLGVLDKLLILDNTAELRTLVLYYKSMDVFLAASQIGESFGMVIAEAMTLGTPVVTISTEDRDNAQIELIDNLQSGLVVERKKTAIASALSHLYKNRDVAKTISVEAQRKVERNYKAQRIAQSLEKLIFDHFGLSHNHTKLENTLIKDYSPDLIKDYEKRCTNLFGRSTLKSKILRILKFR